MGGPCGEPRGSPVPEPDLLTSTVSPSRLAAGRARLKPCSGVCHDHYRNTRPRCVPPTQIADVSSYLKISFDALAWMETILVAIEMLHEKAGSEIHVRRMIDIGEYLAIEVGETIGCEHDRLEEITKADEARKGGET